MYQMMQYGGGGLEIPDDDGGDEEPISSNLAGHELRTSSKISLESGEDEGKAILE